MKQSLNDSPVDPQIIAQVHSELRKKLLNKDSLKLISPNGTMNDFRQEYWVLKEQQENPWIFIVISDLYFPERHNFMIQVISTIPPKVWEEDRFVKFKKILMEVTADSDKRDPILERLMSTETGKYSLSKPVQLKEKDPVQIKKTAISLNMDINDHINHLKTIELDIISKISSVLDEYIQTRGL